MQAKLEEYGCQFDISLTPESQDEVVKMARFGIGKLKEGIRCSVWFSESGRVILTVSVKKNRINSSTL